MAALNQDFLTYAGDTVSPIFTVQTTAGVAVNISGATEIVWIVRRQTSAAIALTKKKSAGQITFITDGTDGKFQVLILATDTTALSGAYVHEAVLTDAVGNVTTVTVGRMQVGLAPTWTYDATSLSTNPIYQVRRLIGDVLYNDQQMQDDEISFFVSQYSNVMLAAAGACRSLAAQFGRLVDTVQGDMRTLYSSRSKAYTQMANQYEARGMLKGSAVMAYSGGLSSADKTTQVQNTDRVPPQFNIGMDDNTLPVTPVGSQVPSAPMPNSSGV